MASLYSDNFQLVNPIGETLNETDYLEPDSEIAVRWYGDAAVLRYRSRLEIVSSGEHVPLASYWHMDLYKRRTGQWQVVWSQATAMT